ncbi:MAG: hypothetical protein RLZZ435_2333 [Cyanobacteriota bacterium]|jgi:diguanylate cyclase (GGDEF)-like protein/PAS domain S-box-containing protein
MNPDVLYGRTPEILVADDTLDSLRIISECLNSYGYDVRSVTNGTLALASARAAQPDLILLDIKMPDLSGYEVCRQLKADPLTQKIPIIFLSALNEPLDKVQAFEVGGIDYITKPFHLQEVLARIQNQLALRFSFLQIQTLNDQLEGRVQERTVALASSNQELQAEIQERRRIEADLRESEMQFRQLTEHISEVFWLASYDATQQKFTGVDYVSPAFATIWGYPCGALYANPEAWLEAIHPEDRLRIATAFAQEAIRGNFDEVYRVIHPTGRIHWIHDRGFPIYDKDGTVYRVAGIAEDITQQKRAEQERDRFFNLSLDLLFIADTAGILKRINPAWSDLLGYAPEQMLGECVWDLIHPDDQGTIAALKTHLETGEPIQTLETRCLCQDGSYLWIIWSLVPFPQYSLLYGAGRDISQRKASEAQLVYEALHDGLTGLDNRSGFLQKLELALRKFYRQTDQRFAVLFIDLDNFKYVNDTLGHGVGDELLVQVAQLLKHIVREVDSVARLGGDEFTILLENVENWQAVLRVVDRIQESLQSPFQLQVHQVFTSASLGIVFGNQNYLEVNQILRDADIAMYRAKANGKGCYEIFDQDMYAQTLHIVEMETALRQAINHQELQLYYQPIVNLKTLKLEGSEVLLRWQHPTRGLISAGEFITIAEDTGQIDAIGEWVFQEACKTFQGLCLRGRPIHGQPTQEQSSQHCPPLYFSINVSGRQLRNPSLLSLIDRVLATTQLAPKHLKIELTESSLIENTEVARKILEEIKKRGIPISLDDFGTGFSSLSYLHQFPIDVIKIDRTFVRTLHQEPKARSITYSIITLARALGFGTVAEGIETAEQLSQLQELGCQSGQGYLFSTPLALTAFQDLVVSPISGNYAIHHFTCSE